jgi:hypothetical protein
LALVLDEATQQLIGDSAAEGVWAAFAYFQGATDTHRDLEARYRAVQTGPMPPMSSLSETTYEAIAAYGRIMADTDIELDNKSLRHQLMSQSMEPLGGNDSSSRRHGEITHRGIVLAESCGGIFRPQ